MKLFVLLAALTLAQAAKLDRIYLPPNAQEASGSDNFLQTPHQTSNDIQDSNTNDFSNAPISTVNSYDQDVNSDFESRPDRPQAASERNAAILRQDNSNDGETFSYAYETENGIIAEESGVATNGVEAQGYFSYIGDDGQEYSISYTAGENGFVPQGNHIPTAPPIPEEILRALEKNARDEAAGIFDDGSYNESKYMAVSDSQYQNYETNAQPNYNGDAGGSNNGDAGSSNSAGLRGDDSFDGRSVEKSYLPPFVQRNNNQRNYN